MRVGVFCFKSESKAFPSEIYTDVLKHAAVYKDGSVVNLLRFGLEWTIEEVYAISVIYI